MWLIRNASFLFSKFEFFYEMRDSYNVGKIGLFFLPCQNRPVADKSATLCSPGKESLEYKEPDMRGHYH